MMEGGENDSCAANAQRCAGRPGASASKAELVICDIAAAQSAEDAQNDLQAAFERFRLKKARELRLSRQRLAAVSASRLDPGNMQRLRQLFIDRCLSYIGTPYHPKYHADLTDPLHNAPLYLDCCGLVRKALRDLADDFGFLPGRGNQAYQFDTLPLRTQGVAELQPGDLVFYEATYKDAKRRPQRHGMVHVEVFLGGETGEETVGSVSWQSVRAREGRCGVQRFPSFRQEETGTWALVRYHFCKIDNWLQGECRSHCAAHAWCDVEEVNANGKSIFRADGDESDGDGA